MGPAHCSVVNQTPNPLCIVTFNMPDLLYKTYHTMYIVEPGEQQKVEANPDPNGLKLGVIYETRREKQELYFHRFTCSNDSILTITAVDGNDIDYYGEGTSLQGKAKLRENDINPFNMAAATLHSEFAKAHEPSKAEQEVKKFFRNVKEKSEAVILKVGDKVGLDMTGGKEPSSISESQSNNSLNTMNTNQSPQGIQYDDRYNANHVPSFYQPPPKSSNNIPPVNYSSTLPSSLTSTPSVKGQFGKSDEQRQLYPPTPLAPKPIDPVEEQKKREADLERAKKEKKWEEEIERIKRDREARAAEEAELRKHPHRQSDFKTAPVADANCKVCTIM